MIVLFGLAYSSPYIISCPRLSNLSIQLCITVSHSSFNRYDVNPILQSIKFSNFSLLGFNDKKKLDFNSYVCSLIHHIVVVPISFYRLFSSIDQPFSIYSRYIVTNMNNNSLKLFHCDAAPFSFGYLLADTLLYAVPEALRGNREYFYHHTLGMGLFLAVPYITPDLAEYCGRILIMESTSIFFTTAYLLRNGGYENSIFVPIFEILFAIDFFLVRVVNGFDLYYHILHDLTFAEHENPNKALLGKGLGVLFLPILAMQVYWMIVILKKSFTRFDKKNKKDN